MDRMSNDLCPNCNKLIGSNEQNCENCYYYNDYHVDDLIDSEMESHWFNLIDDLRSLQSE